MTNQIGSLPAPPATPLLPATLSASRWTEDAARGFLRCLRDGASVGDAARAVGVSKYSVYRLKRAAPGFAAAFDAILADPERRAAQLAARGGQPRGFTAARRARFLAVLAETGCVRDAVRAVGLSTTAAYNLRRRDAAFDAAWTRAREEGQQVLRAIAFDRAVNGNEVRVYRTGADGAEILHERRVMPADGLLRLMLEQGDRGGAIGKVERAKLLSHSEWRDGWRFDAEGRKAKDEPIEAVRAAMAEKLRLIHDRLAAQGHRQINIRTGEGITPEVMAAVTRFGGR